MEKITQIIKLRNLDDSSSEEWDLEPEVVPTINKPLVFVSNSKEFKKAFIFIKKWKILFILFISQFSYLFKAFYDIKHQKLFIFGRI